MSNWIIALPREHMEHCIKVKTFGLNRKHILGKVKKGDNVACYITKEYKIIATGNVTQGYFLDDSKIFKADGIFPDRFQFQATQLPAENELDLMKIIDQMTFIKDLAYWSAYFRNGIVQIPDVDWKTIENLVSAQRDR